MSVTSSDIVTEEIRTHSWKVPSSTLVTCFGNVMEVRLEQRQNAPCPTKHTFSGSVTEVRL